MCVQETCSYNVRPQGLKTLMSLILWKHLRYKAGCRSYKPIDLYAHVYTYENKNYTHSFQ